MELDEAQKVAAEIVEIMRPAVEETVRKIRELIEWAGEMFRKMAAVVKKAENYLMDRMLYAANGNPRWWHLYEHAKKYRTRKKYRRLLMKQLIRQLATARKYKEVSA